MKLIPALYTLYSYMVIGVLVLLFFIPVLIILVLPARLRHSWPVYRMIYTFYWLVEKSTLLPITYTGLQNLSREPVIFIANHQSALDIPLLGILARGKPHIWLARQEVLSKFWLLRLILPRIAVIVNTESPTSAMRSLIAIIKIASSEKRDVMIFPEGQRFTTGTVQDFQAGFALLARKLGRPIIPVYIQGVNIVYPPQAWWAQPAPLRVTVGAPMKPQTDEDDTTFKNRVHQWFLTHIPGNDV